MYKWSHMICDLCNWLLSLSMFLRFIHIVACIYTSFPFMGIMFCVWTKCVIHGLFPHVLVTFLNGAAMNMSVRGFIWASVFDSFKYIHRNTSWVHYLYKIFLASTLPMGFSLGGLHLPSMGAGLAMWFALAMNAMRAEATSASVKRRLVSPAEAQPGLSPTQRSCGMARLLLPAGFVNAGSLEQSGRSLELLLKGPKLGSVGDK